MWTFLLQFQFECYFAYLIFLSMCIFWCSCVFISCLSSLLLERFRKHVAVNVRIWTAENGKRSNLNSGFLGFVLICVYLFSCRFVAWSIFDVVDLVELEKPFGLIRMKRVSYFNNHNLWWLENRIQFKCRPNIQYNHMLIENATKHTAFW